MPELSQMVPSSISSAMPLFLVYTSQSSHGDLFQGSSWEQAGHDGPPIEKQLDSTAGKGDSTTPAAAAAPVAPVSYYGDSRRGRGGRGQQGISQEFLPIFGSLKDC